MHTHTITCTGHSEGIAGTPGASVVIDLETGAEMSLPGQAPHAAGEWARWVARAVLSDDADFADWHGGNFELDDQEAAREFAAALDEHAARATVASH